MPRVIFLTESLMFQNDENFENFCFLKYAEKIRMMKSFGDLHRLEHVLKLISPYITALEDA